MRATFEIFRAGLLVTGRSSLWMNPVTVRSLSDELYSDRHVIRQKAQKKIAEMRSVVVDFTDHIEEGIKRRQELQKKAEEYLKDLETSGDVITNKLREDDMKNALAKIREMRELVNEFAFHNQEGIKRRMMMQDMANDYLRALDEYKLKLLTLEPPTISDTRE